MRTSLATLATLAAVVFAVQLSAPDATAQTPELKRFSFTLHSRVTTNKPDGEQDVIEETRHVSSNGSVRVIRKRGDGTVTSDYLYESGKGGFYIQQHEGKKLIKGHAPPEASSKPLPTAQELQADPNFVRTEMLLGRTTYVIREWDDSPAIVSGEKTEERLRAEYYYAPELGRTPLKVVRYLDGKVFSVSEPVSVTFDEPDASLMKAPEGYAVRALAPISGGVLNGKAISKPLPSYPAEARDARAQGVVTVQVLVNEDGTVESAKAVGGHPLLLEVAVEAARRARFSPTLLSGQPMKVTGVVTYNFVLQ